MSHQSDNDGEGASEENNGDSHSLQMTDALNNQNIHSTDPGNDHHSSVIYPMSENDTHCIYTLDNLIDHLNTMLIMFYIDMKNMFFVTGKGNGHS